MVKARAIEVAGDELNTVSLRRDQLPEGDQSAEVRLEAATRPNMGRTNRASVSASAAEPRRDLASAARLQQRKQKERAEK